MTATVDAVRLGVSGGCARNRVGGGLTDGRVVLTSASLVAGAGTVLAAEHITVLRPGTGLAPSMRQRLIGRTITRDVSAGTLFTLEMLQ